MILRGTLFRKYVVYFVTLVTVALIASGGIGVYFTYKESKAALLDLQREKAARRRIAHRSLRVGDRAPDRLDAAAAGGRGESGAAPLRLPETAAPGAGDHRRDPGRPRRRREAARVAARHGRLGRHRGFFERPEIYRREIGQDLFQPGLLPQGNRTVHDDRDGGHQRGSRHYGRRSQSEVHLGRDLAHQDRRQGLGVRDRLARPPDRAPRHQPGAAEVRSGNAAAGAGGACGRRTATTSASASRATCRAAKCSPPTRASSRSGWHVFVEQPIAEAFAPLYESLKRTGLLLLAGLVLSVFASTLVARRMVEPIRAVQDGAARIGAGNLDQDIEVHTGDELESLADQFNTMAAAAEGFLCGPRAQGRRAHARTHGDARTADRHQRNPERHQQFTDQCAAGVRRDRAERAAVV